MVGQEKLRELADLRILIFGLGGVGSFAAEALARSSIGTLGLVEYDIVAPSNTNRQLPALRSTWGQEKIEVCASRLRDINSDLDLTLFPYAMDETNLGSILAVFPPDFIVDAIDDLPAKAYLIAEAKKRGLKIISALGAGYRLDLTQLTIGDISQTHTCPLARRLRRRLKDYGIDKGVPVVWSKETPQTKDLSGDLGEEGPHKGPASMVFVPAAAGLLLAQYVITQGRTAAF